MYTFHHWLLISSVWNIPHSYLFSVIWNTTCLNMYDSLFYRKYEANKKMVHTLVHNPTCEFCEDSISEQH